MIYGIIDCGTNTFNLLLAKVQGKHFQIFYDEKQPVKIGEGGITKKIIQPEAFDRGLKTMQYYKDVCVQKKVDKIFAFATSAIRDAANGKDFVAEVEKITDIKINIISGDKEADYIYKGAMLAIPPTDEIICIMDIGGGSCEFIIADNKQCYWQKSFNIGVARILMHFKFSDPYTEKEKEKVIQYFRNELQELFFNINKYKPTILVGCSGSFESFAEIINQAQQLNLDWNKITSYLFKFEDLEWLYHLLINSTMQQRLQLKGLVSFRADTIVLAIMLVSEVIRQGSFQKILLSCYALKEGVLHEMVCEKND